MNEEVEVKEYKRLSPLSIVKQSPNDELQKIKRGDCVVAFSRRRIFELREAIEDATKLKCAVIYGALPPGSILQS